MQYANIIVDHKAGYEPFTYAIPASLLAHVGVGSVVLVPVGKTKVHGVVTEFIRRTDPELAAKLKPIESVVHEGTFIPRYLLHAVELLHRTYSVGYSDLLFYLLPSFLKRKQKEISYQDTTGEGFRTVEYILSVANRVKLYQSIAQKYHKNNQSILIVCASNIAARALADQLNQTHAITLMPSDIKDNRDYFITALAANKPHIFIGTRGAIMTPLANVGVVIIDEPWLPGQKEERSPRLWTALTAHALCKAKNIPLFMISSIPWPETKLIGNPRRYTVKSDFGKVCLSSRRSLREILTQFLADYDAPKTELAVVLRESGKQMYWCPRCKQSAVMYDRCVICGGEPIILPELSKHAIEDELRQLNPLAHITLLNSEELIQYNQFEAALVLGFDTFLSIVDFRSSSYLVTLLYIIGGQAKETLFVTTHPDEWTNLTHKDNHYFSTAELSVRQEYSLPPYSLAVHLVAKQKDILTKLLPLELDSLLKVGTVKKAGDEYRLSLLFKPGAKIPSEWFKRSYLKVDILPNYIESY